MSKIFPYSMNYYIWCHVEDTNNTMENFISLHLISVRRECPMALSPPIYYNCNKFWINKLYIRPSWKEMILVKVQITWYTFNVTLLNWPITLFYLMSDLFWCNKSKSYQSSTLFVKKLILLKRIKLDGLQGRQLSYAFYEKFYIYIFFFYI